MDRKTARAHAMKLVYEWEMGGDGGEETRLELLEVRPGERGADFMNALFDGVRENAGDIDATLEKFVRGWTLDRLTRVDLAILRVAAYELMYTDTSVSVIVNEAVELANRYSTDKAGAFVNGVLGNLARELEDRRA